jgi:hypothetical protein
MNSSRMYKNKIVFNKKLPFGLDHTLEGTMKAYVD